MIKRVLRNKVSDCFLKYYLRFNVCGCGLFFSLPFKVCVCSSQWTATIPSWFVCRKSAAFMSSSNPNQIQAAWNFKACSTKMKITYGYGPMDWRLVYVQVLDFASGAHADRTKAFKLLHVCKCIAQRKMILEEYWDRGPVSGNKLRIAFTPLCKNVLWGTAMIQGFHQRLARKCLKDYAAIAPHIDSRRQQSLKWRCLPFCIPKFRSSMPSGDILHETRQRQCAGCGL